MAKSDRKKGEAQSSPSSFAPTAPLGAMFLGVAAARNLQMHGEGRPLAALDKATAMRRAGNPRESEVYRETNKIVAGSRYAGVHYGRDGKPRFEMSDADAKIKDVRAIKVGQSARLADLLHHPALYAAVPSAANLRVEKGTNPNASTFDGKTIKLNPTWFAKPALGREQISPAAMTSLLHEIQHHVQDMEGFDAGASISDFAHIADPAERRRQYERVAGEEEARLTGKSFPLRGAERRLRRPGADIAAHEDDPSGFDTPIAKQTLFKDVSAGRERAFFDVQGIRDVVSNAFQQLFSRDMADNKPARFRKLDPRAITSDPSTFQFKSGGDSHGVTDRLKGVKAWDNVAAGKAVVYERANGELVIADGHQRLGLAKRLASEGQKINMDAYVLRERDGWTPKDVYAYAALKNIKESSGNALDMAKVMRERPDLVNGSVPMSDAKVREAANLSKLSKDAFDMVVGGAIKPEYAAQVGARIGDATRHADMLAEMSKAHVASAQHAGLYVDQAMAAGSVTEHQNSLFGDDTRVRSLIAERAAVLDKALSALKSDKRIFSLLEREAGTIEDAGNRLSHETNAARAGEAGNQAALIERLAKNRGPVSDMLEAAARQMAEGKKPNIAARSFVKAVGDTLKAGGMRALTGEAAPATIEAHDPNQNSMFSIEPMQPGQHHVWDAKAREASAVVRASNAKGKKAVARKTRMAMDSEKPPRLTKAQTNPESRAKWDRILDQIPADPKEVKLRARLNGEKLNKRGPLRMAVDGPKRETLKASEIDFGGIKSRVGNSLATHEWDVDNGGKVIARTKTTMKGGGEIKTAYLHITVQKPDGSSVTYREQPNGNFKSYAFSGPKAAPKAEAPKTPKPVRVPSPTKYIYGSGAGRNLKSLSDRQLQSYIEGAHAELKAARASEPKNRSQWARRKNLEDFLGYARAESGQRTDLKNRLAKEHADREARAKAATEKAASDEAARRNALIEAARRKGEALNTPEGAKAQTNPESRLADPIKVMDKRNETARSLIEQAKSIKKSGGSGKSRLAAAQDLVKRNEADLAKAEMPNGLNAALKNLEKAATAYRDPNVNSNDLPALRAAAARLQAAHDQVNAIRKAIPAPKSMDDPNNILLGKIGGAANAIDRDGMSADEAIKNHFGSVPNAAAQMIEGGLSKREQSHVDAAKAIQKIGTDAIAMQNEWLQKEHGISSLDEVRAMPQAKREMLAKAWEKHYAKMTSGKRGTQNAANLEAINANKKAKAKGKAAPSDKALARMSAKDRATELIRRRNAEASKAAAPVRDVKNKAKQLARAEKMGVALPKEVADANGHFIKGYLDQQRNQARVDKQVAAAEKRVGGPDNIPKAIREQGPSSMTVYSELVKPKRQVAAKAEKPKSAAAAKADKYVAEQEARLGKPESSTLSTGALGSTYADRERRFISRMRAGDSQKTDAELKADYARLHAANVSPEEQARRSTTAERMGKVFDNASAPLKEPAPKAKRGPKGGKVLGLLAPIAIGAAMIATAKEAKAEGRSTGDAIKEAAKVGTEGTGTMIGFMAAHAGAVALAGKAGISAAKAVPGVNALMMAGNAAYEAAKAPAGHRLEAAARGAWDMSLPGMIVNTAKQVGSLLPETHNIGGRGAARGPAKPKVVDSGFSKANQAFKASQTGGQQTSTITSSTQANPPAKRGFANFKVQAAAKAAQGKTFQKFTRSDLS